MIKDTAYNLEIRLQRIDEKITSIAADSPSLPEDSSIDLQDEKDMTVQYVLTRMTMLPKVHRWP